MPCICLAWRWDPLHMGLRHQPMHNGFICCQPVISRLPKSALITVGGNSMMMDPYLHPQHMKVVKCLVSTCMCLEQRWDPFHMGLEPQPMHKGFIHHQAVTKDFSRLPKSGLITVDGNSMMMDPYPHPQHMRHVIPLVYVWSKGGIHSTWVWSINQCTRASYTTKQWPRISADFPNLDLQEYKVERS
jgi:hypothetical protein